MYRNSVQISTEGEKNEDVKEEQMNKHESESTEKQPEQINNR